MVRADQPLTCPETGTADAVVLDKEVPQPWKQFKIWASIMYGDALVLEEQYRTLLDCWEREQEKRKAK